jgi:hypothetical protein
MHCPYRPLDRTRRISPALWPVNLLLIILTSPAGLFPLAGCPKTFGSPASAPPALSRKAVAAFPTTAHSAMTLSGVAGEKSRVTTKTATTTARRRGTIAHRYGRASMAAGVVYRIAISGKVTVGSQGFGNVTLTLTSTDDSFTPLTVRSSSTGGYAFGNLPKGLTYRLTPSRTNYTFTPAHIWLGKVNANVPNQDFVGVLKTFKISGRVGTGAGGLEGVTMTLTCSRPTGIAPRTTTTDGDGFYSFSDVRIAGYYTLTASKRNYTFDQASRSYPDLSENQKYQNFRATLNSYSISGNVIVKDVAVTLSGSATQTVMSDGGGGYSFTGLAPTGDYTVTPSKQDYTFDSQSQSFTDLSDNQVADFAIIASPHHVLAYDGLSKRLGYKNFWPAGVDLGHFFWEFWAMPGENAGSRYLLSDGYGGTHALLFGFYGAGQRYVLGGNIFDGTQSTLFESDEGPALNEWGDFAVGWDGKTIVTYFDGVPVGMKEWTGPRRCIGPSGGGGNLYLGGSNHQNLIGRIAQIRGYEGSNPLEVDGGATPPLYAYAPQTFFDCSSPLWQNCSLLNSLINPARPVADLSVNQRVGNLSGLPPPEYIIDPTAPTASTGGALVPPIDTSPPPPPSPGDALVFDSFSRRNSTYALGGAGGMGSTEGGLAGPQPWQYDSQTSEGAPFGILNARAVMLANEAHAAWVPTGSSTGNLDVRVDRQPGIWRSGISTGLVFRFQDANNFFFAYTTGARASQQLLYLSSVVDGSTTALASGVVMPARWTTLRVVTLSTGSIDVYADATLVYSASSDVLATATNAGLWNWGANQGLYNRWDNFTVREVPTTGTSRATKGRAF